MPVKRRKDSSFRIKCANLKRVKFFTDGAQDGHLPQLVHSVVFLRLWISIGYEKRTFKTFFVPPHLL